MDDHDNDSDDGVRKADEYHHPDGTVEVVFAIEDEGILTVREYGSVEAFAAATDDAEYAGRNEAVAELPGVDAFRDGAGAAQADAPDVGTDEESRDAGEKRD